MIDCTKCAKRGSCYLAEREIETCDAFAGEKHSREAGGSKGEIVPAGTARRAPTDDGSRERQAQRAGEGREITGGKR